MTLPLTSDGLRTHASSLPQEWEDDDDPNWIVPMGDFSAVIGVLDPYSGPMQYRIKPTEDMVIITPDTPIYTGQDSLRLDALVHYLDARHSESDLFDPDGWFGTDHPVVLPHEDGYRVYDGNHRTIADRICGRSTIAYLARIED